MLSILIPVYNYDVFALVNNLHNQCTKSKITFEILCLDDASNLFTIENQRITQFENTSFLTLESNIGRSAIRNLLAKKANFENLLFLDADTIPVHDNFILNYIFQINNEEKIVYGGISYQSEKPSKEKLLRWVYGRKRESISPIERNKNPSKFALVSNLLIQKEIVKIYPFDETIHEYGYEDLLFFSILKSKDIQIIHIENPTYHLNLESSNVFLDKTKTALKNLKILKNSKKLSQEDSKIIAASEYLKKMKLIQIFTYFFITTQAKIEQNLISEKPSLFLFDLYKLGYYCTLNIK
jgi:hypothetical protein